MPPKDRANISDLGQEIFADQPGAEHPVDTISKNEDRLVPIPLERIRPNPDQPRQHFDETELDDLAASIKQNGLRQPVVVEEDRDRFTLLVDERRWRAAEREAGNDSCPVSEARR